MRDFFKWWFGQLSALVPFLSRHRRASGNKLITLNIDGDVLLVPPNNSADGIQLDVSSTSKDPLEANAIPIDHLPDDLNALRIRLAPQEFLSRRITLPASARSHLREAVGYQLPRLTPFSSDQVFYACGMDDPDKATQNVWLVAVPRQKINAALSMLGLIPSQESFELDKPPQPGEWLEFVWRFSPKQKSALNIRKGLSVGALTILAIAASLHLYNKHRVYEDYSNKLEKLHKQIKEVGQLQDRLSNITTRANYLNNKKLSAISTLQILESLSQELKDDTWLQSFEIKDNKLVLQGLSPTPASLIELLEHLPLLSNVRFKSAITEDARRQTKRFSISADVSVPMKMESGK